MTLLLELALLFLRWFVERLISWLEAILDWLEEHLDPVVALEIVALPPTPKGG